MSLFNKEKFKNILPPSELVADDVIMNSISGQSSVWFPYFVVIKPTLSRPTLDVRGPFS